MSSALLSAGSEIVPDEGNSPNIFLSYCSNFKYRLQQFESPILWEPVNHINVIPEDPLSDGTENSNRSHHTQNKTNYVSWSYIDSYPRIISPLFFLCFFKGEYGVFVS